MVVLEINFPIKRGENPQFHIKTQ